MRYNWTFVKLCLNESLPGGFVKEHDGWIVDEFQSDGESFALSTGQVLRVRVPTF